MLGTSAIRSLYGAQFTLSTRLIKPNYLVILTTDAAPQFFYKRTPFILLTYTGADLSPPQRFKCSLYQSAVRSVPVTLCLHLHYSVDPPHPKKKPFEPLRRREGADLRVSLTFTVVNVVNANFILKSNVASQAGRRVMVWDLRNMVRTKIVCSVLTNWTAMKLNTLCFLNKRKNTWTTKWWQVTQCV